LNRNINDSDRVLKAVAFAANAHGRTKRMDRKTMYVVHPIRVATSLKRVFGLDDDAARTAAILHDTVEDTTVTIEDVVAEFGLAIGEVVAALTNDGSIKDKADRREEHLTRLATSGLAMARVIKLADAYDNMGDAKISPAFEARTARWAMRTADVFEDVAMTDIEKRGIEVVRKRGRDILSSHTEGVTNG